MSNAYLDRWSPFESARSVFEDQPMGMTANSGQPPRNVLFGPVTDSYGTRLALVFGNQAKNGKCPFFAAEDCRHCDIGVGEGQAFCDDENGRRLDWYVTHYSGVLPRVSHLVVFNSGSVLNPEEMPGRVLRRILSRIAGIADLKAISLDTREQYVKVERLLRIAASLPEPTPVRVILGIETANDELRVRVLKKQMTRAGIRAAFREVGRFAAHVGAPFTGVDVNVVVAGPGTTPETAVRDTVETVEFALELGDEFGVSVDFNLNPYYPSKRGLRWFPGQERCPLAVVARAVTEGSATIRGKKKDSSIYVGWNDEGHDQEPAKRGAESAAIRPILERFNADQDPSAFRNLLGSFC